VLMSAWVAPQRSAHSMSPHRVECAVAPASSLDRRRGNFFWPAATSHGLYLSDSGEPFNRLPFTTCSVRKTCSISAGASPASASLRVKAAILA
jgi:hypothetical protein